MTTTNFYKMSILPIYATCGGNYKVVTDTDVLEIIKCNDERQFNFLVKLREFGYIRDFDLYDQVYQDALDYLMYTLKDKWFLLGGNIGPSQVKTHTGQIDYMSNLNTIVKHVEPMRLMEWMWGQPEYKRLVSYLR